MTNKVRLAMLVLICLSLGILCACKLQFEPKAVPSVENGLLDLRNWNLNVAGPVALDGKWEFYWQAHLKPIDFTADKPPVMTGFIKVPGIWNGYQTNDDKLPGIGFATYRLRILLGDSYASLAFKFLDMAVAYSAYVNGERLTAAGKPGKSLQSTVPQFHPKVVEFKPYSKQLEMIIHVSNFHHRKGGAWESVLLGTRDDLWQKRQKAVHFNLFLFGGILIMGIYHIGMYVFRTQDKSPLFFGIFCFLIAIRILVTGERYLIELLPNFNWEIHTKFAYLSFYLAVPTFAVYAKNIFPDEISKFAIYVITLVGVIFSGIVLFFPALVYSYTVAPFQIFTILAFCYGFFVLVMALYRKRRGARFFLIGFLALSITGINDILYSHLIIETGYMIQLGFFVFIFSQAFLLSRLFSNAFGTVESQRLVLENTNKTLKSEIMERRRTEDALRESEEKYRQLVENANEVIIVAQDGMLQFVNKRTTDFSGYSEQELKSKPFIEWIHPEDRDIVRHNYQKHISGEPAPTNYTVRCIHKDGSIKWVEVSSVRISWERSPATLTFLSDRTDRRKLEEELLKAQKLESIGVLAGGIAHDFNNILASIMGNISLAKIHLESQKYAKNFLEKAETASKRATGLTQQLLTFSKGGAPVKQATAISDIITDCSTFILSGSKVKCEFNLPKDLWSVEIDAGQISQVIQNIIINADQAMPEGGIIQINAENLTVTADHGLPLNDGRYVRITIGDSGSGIPQEYIDKIFDPYFTTKPNGSGLGLATAYAIMERHNGHISVRSNIGDGTVLTLYLPTSDEKEPVKEEDRSGTLAGCGKILAMDDEEMIRDLVDHMLRHLGYEVETASTGEEAVRLYRRALEAGRPFDLVVLDLTVPGAMGGKEALDKLREIDPGVKAIVSSGYSNDPIMADYRSYGFIGVVTKPYSVRNLSETLDKSLN